MNNIITKSTQIIVVAALLVLAAWIFILPASAQSQKAQPGKELSIGKKGEVHFYIQVKAGDAVLKSGMYQVQHTVAGSEHVLIFKEMSMQAGYKMGNTPVGKEVARIKCKIEPVANKVSNTKITLRTNAAGEKEIAEVQVAGEAYKHLL